VRIILSEGQVNIFNLAKNAGTSVDQIERFYARNLPLSKEMAITCRVSGVHKTRRQLIDDSAILDFLLAHVGWFDMYVEGEYAAHVRYCFENMLDAEIFRARFEPKQVIEAGGMSVYITR